MWAQQWDNIETIVKPYDDTTILDVTEEMVKQVSCCDPVLHDDDNNDTITELYCRQNVSLG